MNCLPMAPFASNILGLSSPTPAFAGVLICDAMPVSVLEPVLDELMLWVEWSGVRHVQGLLTASVELTVVQGLVGEPLAGKGAGPQARPIAKLESMT